MHPFVVPYARPVTASGTEAGGVNCKAALMLRFALIGPAVADGVVALPVSEALSVNGTFTAGKGPAATTEVVAHAKLPDAAPVGTKGHDHAPGAALIVGAE